MVDNCSGLFLPHVSWSLVVSNGWGWECPYIIYAQESRLKRSQHLEHCWLPCECKECSGKSHTALSAEYYSKFIGQNRLVTWLHPITGAIKFNSNICLEGKELQIFSEVPMPTRLNFITTWQGLPTFWPGDQEDSALHLPSWHNQFCILGLIPCDSPPEYLLYSGLYGLPVTEKYYKLVSKNMGFLCTLLRNVKLYCTLDIAGARSSNDTSRMLSVSIFIFGAFGFL